MLLVTGSCALLCSADSCWSSGNTLLGGCLLRCQRRLALVIGSLKWCSACAGCSATALTNAGGSKKRGADIAGMPSKRSNLADRLGPAGMSTLAVLLGHDVTQADLDRLQQVGAAEARQAVGPPHQRGQVAALCVHISLCAAEQHDCSVPVVTSVNWF